MALTAQAYRVTFESMLKGKLGYWGCCFALGLSCFACSSDPEGAPKPAQTAGGGAAGEGVTGGGAASGGAASGGATAEACDVAGRETDVCQVWVNRKITCSAATESEATLLAQCHTEMEDYPNRAAPCFVAEYSECLGTSCGSDDKCYSDAIVANDPSVVDIERYRACSASTPNTDCANLTAGFIKACLARVDECDVWDDLCASIATLKQPYRAEGEACLERDCAEMEGCFYAATGRTKPMK